MRVEFNGTKYRFWFQHFQTDRPSMTYRKPSETTCCYIGLDSEDRTGDPMVIASGEATRFHKDRPDREIGRKVALKRALEDLSKEKWVRPKELNQAFWKVYLGRKKSGGATMPATVASAWAEAARTGSAGLQGIGILSSADTYSVGGD